MLSLKILSFLPLVGVNLWHGILSLQYRRANRPNTLSEQAANRPKLLRTHQAIHSLSSLFLIAFAASFLIPHHLYLAALLLICGAICDVIEVKTLHKDVPGHPTASDPHQVSAWGMAIFYLFYGITIGLAAGLPLVLVHSIWLIFLITVSVSVRLKFKNFWMVQTVYFNYLALLILISHVIVK